MTYNEACEALKKEGAPHTDPLYYAYCDGYYAARTMKTPTLAHHYVGVSTINGYFKNNEVIKKYEQGLRDGLRK